MKFTPRLFLLLFTLCLVCVLIQLADKHRASRIDNSSNDLHAISGATQRTNANGVKKQNDAFKITVYTEYDDTHVPIYLNPSLGLPFHFEVDCDGDGTYEIQNHSENIDCHYSRSGMHQIAIRGELPGIYVRSRRAHTDMKVNPWVFRSVDQWGDIAWKTTEAMFESQAEIEFLADDLPNLTRVKSMERMFKGTHFNAPNISHWDVSNVENMASLFEENSFFNQPLSGWQTQNVKSMKGMFRSAISFNQPIQSWNIEQVEDLSEMFYNAKAFQQPLKDWNTKNVKNMQNMFAYSNFNSELSGWDTSKVHDFSYMFAADSAFNQDIHTWDTSNAHSMFAMFYNATSFNQPLENWNVSKVHTTSHMFHGAKSFNQSLDRWDISNLVSARNMFAHATAFSQSMRSWKPSSLKDVTCMFSFSGFEDLQMIMHWVSYYSIDARNIRSKNQNDECFDPEIGE